mgnify:FL=1
MDIGEAVQVTTRVAWRAWLARHHATVREIWFIYHEKASSKASVAYGDAVEEALCYGWIDSTVKTLDPHRYAQRFTPRKAGSNWSAPNLERVARLMKAGQMTPAGRVHLPSKAAAKEHLAAHMKRTTTTTVAPRDLAAAMKAAPKAVAFWKTLTPGYKRLYVRWIIEAKRAETRAARVVKAVDRLERGLKNFF